MALDSTVSAHPPRAELPDLDDEALVALARQHSEPAIRTIVRRHNQRLFRVARAILRNDAEAEDAVQAAYVSAFTHLDGFRGDAKLTTWLTRIAVNEATGRLRSHRPSSGIEALDLAAADSARIIQFPLINIHADPEAEMARLEIRDLLERTVDTLPETFRAVFVMRDIEAMTIEETAGLLGLKPETVKTRLHRARKLMRAAIETELSGAFSSLFPFDGLRCVHLADRVLAELRARR